MTPLVNNLTPNKIILCWTELVIENGVDITEVDAGTKLSIDQAMGRKRKISLNDDSDEEDGFVAPPAHDIYRARQQKKVR